jgi:integral membrane protein (TIGR00529 family)
MLFVFLAVVLFIIGATLSRRVDVSISLAAGAVAYGVAAFGPGVLAATAAAFNTSMAYVLTSLIFAMALGFLLREQKTRIASGLSALGARAAAFAIPAAIGLLPMPGGAYISAVVVDPLYDKMGLKSHQKTFLNYWMRHIWIPVWPLFQGVLITAAVLGVSVWQVVEWAWPGALFAVAAGVAVAASLVKPVPVAGDPRDLTALWPLAAVAALSFLVPLPLAVAAVYLAYVVVNKVGRDQLAASLKYALNPRILAIIVFSLVFAQYIKESGLGAQLAQALGPYSGLAVFLIPFAVGLATGVEFTFAGLAFPPISSLIHGPALALAFAGGFLGVMLSPAHSCFVLTREYYQADVGQVYRLLAKAAAAVVALSAAYYVLIFY